MKWLFSLVAIPCLSLPIGPTFMAGDGSVACKDTQTLEIQAGAESILHWDSFNVLDRETVVFHLPSKESVALNRVIGPGRSEIFGSILSNGQVILINPAGILIGKEAVINTQSWIASTFDLNEKNFLETKDWQFQSASNASIEIEGAIHSPRIAILAKEILCGGTLTGDQIDLVSALCARVSSGGRESRSSIGNIDFSGSAKANGISLLADSISLSGNLEGNSLLIGGGRQGSDTAIANASFVSVAPSARIVTNRGGEAIFFAENHLNFEGDVFAPGGFVEISGLKSFSYRGTVDTDGTGTLLFDPNEIQIVAAGMTTPGPLTPFYDGSPSVSATILNTDLSTLLGGGTSVIIQTNASISGGSGNITQDAGAPVSWAATANLTLIASQSILINDTISASGDGSLITLVANQGDVVLTSTAGLPAILEVNGLYPAATTSISISAPNGSLSINAAPSTIAFVQANNTTSCGDIRVSSRSLDFIAAPATTANATCGIQSRRGDIYLTVSGPMHFVGGGGTAFQSNASVVAGITGMGGSVGGNVYFSAGSIDFDSSLANAGAQSGTSLSAYGFGLNSGNIIGTVSGDVVFRSGYFLASGSGISSLFEGEIQVAIGGNLSCISTSGPSAAFCGTGIRTLFSGGAGSSRSIQVAIAGNLNAISGNGADAGAGIGGDGNISVAVQGAALFQVTNGTGLSGDCLFSNLGSIQFAANTISFLGNSSTPLPSHVTAQTDISISSIGDMNLDFGLVESAAGNISLSSLNGSIFFSNNTSLQAAAQLLAIASRNIVMTDSTGQSLNDRIIFVVDNAFPTPPLIGPGAFLMDPSSLTAPLGVSIYTARQNQNSITNSTLNGSLFVPGTLFVNTAQEIWCTYFPGGVSSLPFTIFYKDCTNQTAYEANLVVSEFLRDLHPYDESLGWMEDFSMDQEPYTIWRRQLLFNTPKSWTALMREFSPRQSTESGTRSPNLQPRSDSSLSLDTH